MRPMLQNIRIVLVSPSGPANVGAACRAMANMGLSDLAIVAPRCNIQDENACAYASHGRPVLEGAQVVDSIPAALADCVLSVATSSKLGLYRRQAAIAPAEAAHIALQQAAAGRVAFAFGPENHGLKTHDLLHFDRIVTIPADEAYPVLNLAASVMVICYELRRTWINRRDEDELPMAISSGLANDQRKQRLFQLLFESLERIGFFRGQQNPDHLRHALRHLFGRVDMTINEADILIGLARQIGWYVDHHPTRVDPPAENPRKPE